MVLVFRCIGYYYDASIDDEELVPIGDGSGANANILTCIECMRKIFGKIERMNASETLLCIDVCFGASSLLHLTGTTHRGERKKTSEKLETLAEQFEFVFYNDVGALLSLSHSPQVLQRKSEEKEEKMQ